MGLSSFHHFNCMSKQIIEGFVDTASYKESYNSCYFPTICKIWKENHPLNLCVSYPMLTNFVQVWEKLLQTLKCRHVECSFEKPAENFSPEVRNLFAQSPKIFIKL